MRSEKLEYTVRDTKVTGLGVRVRPSGHRAFVCLDSRGGSSRRRTFGRTTLMTVDDVRARCLAFQSAGTRELEPVTAVPRFRDFLDGIWKPECYAHQKSSSRHTVASYLKNQLLPAFGDMPLDRIHRRSVHLWFDRYSATAPGGANRALGVLRQIMNHAKDHGHIEVNRAGGIRRNRGAGSPGSSPAPNSATYTTNWTAASPQGARVPGRPTSSVCSPAPAAGMARSGP